MMQKSPIDIPNIYYINMVFLGNCTIDLPPVTVPDPYPKYFYLPLRVLPLAGGMMSKRPENCPMEIVFVSEL